MVRPAAALLLTLVALSGCTQEREDPLPRLDAGAAGGTVLGLVLDAAYRPVQGAAVLPTNASLATTTDGDGTFLLRLPPGAHPLRIEAAGFEPHAETAEVHPGQRTDLNITLQRLPPPPRVEVQDFQGFIQCDVIVQPTHSHGNNHTHNNQRCDEAVGGDRHVWDLPVRAGPDGMVVELAWEPNNEFARFLYVRVEAGDGSLLADTEMDSPLRLQVAQAQLHQHVPDGGLLRVVALVGTGEDAGGGNDFGVALQFQQEFEAFASIFYGAPSAPDYSLLR